LGARAGNNNKGDDVKDSGDNHRVKHRLVQWGSEGLGNANADLTNACHDLEEQGYMLTGLVQVNQWVAVAVFVGAESLVIPSSVEVALEPPQETRQTFSDAPYAGMVAEPSEIVLEADGP
jgi:hypothetical protein